MNTWELITNNRFEEAIRQADIEYEALGDVFVLRNKVYALFHLERYQECILLEQKIIEMTSGDTDTDFIFLGIAEWLLGDRERAILTWKLGRRCLYTDAAGGVEIPILLFYGSILTNDLKLRSEVLRKFNKISQSTMSQNWPGPLIQYILGHLSVDEVFALTDSNELLRKRQLCQLDFVGAVKEIEKGNIENYKTELLNTVSHGPSSYLEQFYFLAKGEIELMNRASA